MAFASPHITTSRIGGVDSDLTGTSSPTASSLFGVPRVVSSTWAVDVPSQRPSVPSAPATKWPPAPSELSTLSGHWGAASSPPPGPQRSQHASALTDTTNVRNGASPAAQKRLFRQPVTAAELSDAPRLVEAPPLDVDTFALEDLEPTEQQLQLQVKAAMQSAQLNANMVNSINKLTYAARQQHADTLAVAQQQARDAARLEAAWSVAASARSHAAQIESGLDRHTRASEEMNAYVRLELNRHNGLLEQLLRRTRRNEILLRGRAVDVLLAANRRTLGQRFMSRWLRFTLLRRSCAHLLSRSERHGALSRWRTWTAFVARRRQLRSWFSTLDYLEDKNNKILVRRFIGQWTRYRQRRIANRTAADRLGRQSARFVAVQVFHRWMRHAKTRHLLRAQFISRMNTSSVYSTKARAKLLLRYYNKWAVFVVNRRGTRRSNRLAHQLLIHVHATAMRKRFNTWLRVARHRKHQRVEFVNLTRRNASAVAVRFFRLWERWNARRWVIKYTASQVAPIERKVDIGLRTTANTNQTIQKLIENFQYLDSKLQEMRLGGRMGILGARESSMAHAPQLDPTVGFDMSNPSGGLAAPPFPADVSRYTNPSFPMPPPATAVAGSLRAIHNPYLGLGATEISGPQLQQQPTALAGSRSKQFGHGPIVGGVSGTTTIAPP